MNQFIDFDEKLYAGLRQGDEAAFTVVFERYNRLLYALAYRYLKSGEEAEDAVQYTGSVVILGGLTFVNFPLCIHLC